jgi:hypothetical protein
MKRKPLVSAFRVAELHVPASQTLAAKANTGMDTPLFSFTDGIESPELALVARDATVSIFVTIAA